MSVPPFFSGAACSSHCSGVLAIAAYCRGRRSICRYSATILDREPAGDQGGAPFCGLCRGSPSCGPTSIPPLSASQSHHRGPHPADLGLDRLRPVGFALRTLHRIFATTVFNFYFLPPVRTFTIAGTQKLDRPFCLSHHRCDRQPIVRSGPQADGRGRGTASRTGAPVQLQSAVADRGQRFATAERGSRTCGRILRRLRCGGVCPRQGQHLSFWDRYARSGWRAT